MDLQVRTLLERAAALRLASLALGHPHAERGKQIRALAQEVSLELRPEAAALAGLDLAAADVAHHRILGSAGAVSGCESAYPNGFSSDQGAVLADVSAFYQAFAFCPGEEIPEPPDHAAAQLSYLAFLSTKEAFALYQGEKEKAEVCQRAYRDFCLAHLGRWCAALGERLAACEGSELPLAGVRLALKIMPPGLSPNPSPPSL